MAVLSPLLSQRRLPTSSRWLKRDLRTPRAWTVFILLPSLLVLSGDAVNPGCECLVYSGTYGKEFGRFSSPDYPKPYPPGIDCLLYTFIAGSHEVIELIFKDFDVHNSSPTCDPSVGDFVRVYLEASGGVNELTPSTGLLCGRQHRTLYSTGPLLVLELHTSQRQTNSSGFLGTFRFLATGKYQTVGERVPGTSCDFEFSGELTGTEKGKLYSPRYPSSYPKGSRCSYTFTARRNERVRIVFEELSLQKSDVSCLLAEDLVRVHDGGGPLSPVMAVLCNEASHTELISSGRQLHLYFTSSSDWPGHGFVATYYFIPATASGLGYTGEQLVGPAVSATRSSCDVKLSSDSSKNGSITSPGFPAPYPPRSRCRYEFAGSGKERVQLVFTDFSLFQPNDHQSKDCEGIDSVTVYVVIEGRLEKIDSFCGVALPRPIMSNGHRLMIQFSGVYSSRHARGFRAKYSFLQNFGIRSGEQAEEYSCGFRYRVSSGNSGHFHSPNYPGLYPRNTECHYFFHAEDGMRIRIHFTFFDIEGVHPCDAGSASDYVEFSNFMGLDRKYSRQCGSMEPFEVESERKFFRVTFRSNDRLDATGFNATYLFVEDPTPSPTPQPTSSAVTRMSPWLLLVLIFAT